MPHPKEDRIRRHGSSMSKRGGGRNTPKRRMCRDCDFKPPFLRISTRCPKCKGVLRVIRYD